MSANAVNRKDVQAQLVTLFSTELTGSGNPLHVVGDDTHTDFSRGPLMLVQNRPDQSIRRDIRGIGTAKYKSYIKFFLLVLVPTQGQTSTATKDSRDDIEQAIADVIADNQSNSPYWHNLHHDNDYSVLLMDDTKKQGFQAEVIAIEVEVHD